MPALFFPRFLILSNLTWSLRTWNAENYLAKSEDLLELIAYPLLAQSITYHSHIIFQLLQSNFAFLQCLQRAPAEKEKYPRHKMVTSAKMFLLSEPHRQLQCPRGWMLNNKFLEGLGKPMSSQMEKELPFWRVSQDIQETLHFTQVLLPIWNNIRNTNAVYKNSFHTCRKKHSILLKVTTWANIE